MFNTYSWIPPGLTNLPIYQPTNDLIPTHQDLVVPTEDPIADLNYLRSRIAIEQERLSQLKHKIYLEQLRLSSLIWQPEEVIGFRRAISLYGKNKMGLIAHLFKKDVGACWIKLHEIQQAERAYYNQLLIQQSLKKNPTVPQKKVLPKHSFSKQITSSEISASSSEKEKTETAQSLDFQLHPLKKIKRTRWIKKEDDLLTKLVTEWNPDTKINWKTIASYFPKDINGKGGRTDSSCYERWFSHLSQKNLCFDFLSEEQMTLLISLFRKYLNWTFVTREFNRNSGKKYTSLMLKNFYDGTQKRKTSNQKEKDLDFNNNKKQKIDTAAPPKENSSSVSFSSSSSSPSIIAVSTPAVDTLSTSDEDIWKYLNLDDLTPLDPT